MDPLKIFATLETSLSEAQLFEYLSSCGWSPHSGTPNQLCMNDWLKLEYSGGGLYSIRGEMPRTDHLDQLLEPIIRSLTHQHIHFHLDVFEEDGRLVKRLQN